jgi:uncharacterized protein
MAPNEPLSGGVNWRHIKERQMHKSTIKSALRVAFIACSCLIANFLVLPLRGQVVHQSAPSPSKASQNGPAFQVDQSIIPPATTAQKGLGYQVEKDVMVKMTDGTKLATDIYRPAKEGVPLPGKFPVVVYRTPYNKNGLHHEGIFFAQHGYVVVAQDCRGRFSSEGRFYLLLSDGHDGYDTIEWAAAQPWSNGKVGTAGASYEAWTQYSAAMLSPPHLVAMFPVVGSGSFFHNSFSGGVPNMNMSQWDLYMAQTSKEAETMPAARAELEAIFKNPDPWLQLPPRQRAEILKPFPDYMKIFLDAYAHPALDSYWKQQDLYPAGNYRKFKDVPMFFISGWYDGTVGGVIDNFEQLSALQSSPKKLMIGPWPHATGSSTCGEAYFGQSAIVDEQALQLDWFNHWLKAEPLRLISSEPVQIFQMGGGVEGEQPHGKIEPGGKWLSFHKWPQPAAGSVNLYLQPEGLLRNLQSVSAGSASFEDDPANPVPTHGGYFHGDCVQDQAILENRADLLTFTTPLLTASTTIGGEVEAHLWISSSAPDTDFIAKLIDVYPNGYAMIVAEGELRVGYRNGLNELALMAPGTIYPLTITMGPTSNQFAAGHRIRLDISSTDFPRLEPNPNTVAPPGQWTTTTKARNSVYYGGQHPSHLILPLLNEPSSVSLSPVVP